MKAFVFPGQGSQIVGMGKSLYNTYSSAKLIFEEINDSINQNLTKIMFEGPEEKLLITANTQVALMSVSIAILKVMEHDFGFDIKKEVSFVAGHSVGEYTALAVAEVLDIPTVAKLLKVRGTAMVAASPLGYGAMAAIIGIQEIEKIQELINDTKEPSEICVIANDNSFGQTVISGNVKSVENAMMNAKKYGAKIVVKLPVGGSFHSPLMQKVSETLAEHLNNISFNDAQIPVVVNTLAKGLILGDEIKAQLVDQVVKGVRWRESMIYLLDAGVTHFVEVGQGSILTGLMKRIDHTIDRYNIQDSDHIIDFMNQIRKPNINTI